MGGDQLENPNLNEFYQSLIRPQSLSESQLTINSNQVAGHAGFFSLRDDPGCCLKPFNVKCVRGRREHLFYQIIEHFKRNTSLRELSTDGISENNLNTSYSYDQITLLKYPETKCNCVVDESLIKLLSPFIANFYHVRYLELENENSPKRLDDFLRSVYSENLSCPCYGRDPVEKLSCSRDFKRVNFLCLEDLTAHCQEPCIIDIKIGRITYDPMAIKEKVLEQSSKYKRLREFGFRVLGMKLKGAIKDKSYGKSLETSDQILEALNCFFLPLSKREYKIAVIGKILNRIGSLLSIFEGKNINQLKFFSSSLLIVYDSFVMDQHKSLSSIQSDLAESVRVSMIDFAHVFHIHDEIHEGSSLAHLQGKDYNYIFGLRKLEHFLLELNRQHYSHPQDLHFRHPELLQP